MFFQETGVLDVPRHRLRSQIGGAGLLIIGLLLVLTMAGSWLVAAQMVQWRQKKTQQALAQARLALLGWSLSRDGTSGQPNCSASGTGRACAPVELPCPADPAETDPAKQGTARASCGGAPAAPRLGWLPWKTLGIAPLSDGAGQLLWYAVDRQFAVRTSVSEARKVNGDSFGSTVFIADGVPMSLPGGVAAVVLAPGRALAGQARGGVFAPQNYLEAGAGWNNALPGGPFGTQMPTEYFNDQIEVLAGGDLIGLASHRAGVQVAGQLQAYNCAAQMLGVAERWPYPADIRATACRTQQITSVCTSVADLCAGILPRQAESWTGQPAIVANHLPGWFQQNIWHRNTLYAVRQGHACAAAFVIDGQAREELEAIFILPGAPQVPRANSLAGNTAATASTDLRLYLEDEANQDAWQGEARHFVTPSCQSNDQLFVCTATACRPERRTC